MDVGWQVCTGSVSFGRLAGRRGPGLYSRIHEQQQQRCWELYYFSCCSSDNNPRATGHESPPSMHLHPAYYPGREPDKKRDNTKEVEDQRQSVEQRTK